MFGKPPVGSQETTVFRIERKDDCGLHGLSVASEQASLIIIEVQIFKNICFISLDTSDGTEKPCSVFVVIDPAFADFRFEKLKIFAAIPIQQDVAVNIANVVVSAELVNETVTENLQPPQLPDKCLSFNAGAAVGDIYTFGRLYVCNVA
jgi:hypothetical protein